MGDEREAIKGVVEWLMKLICRSPSATLSFHFILLFRMGRMIEMKCAAGSAAQGKQKKWNFFGLFAAESWWGWDGLGVVLNGWVMGAAAPMAPPKEANQPKPIHQFLFNKAKEREWSQWTERQAAIHLWIKRQWSKLTKWSTKQPRCAASPSANSSSLLPLREMKSWNWAEWLLSACVAFFFFLFIPSTKLNGIERELKKNGLAPPSTIKRFLNCWLEWAAGEEKKSIKWSIPHSLKRMLLHWLTFLPFISLCFQSFIQLNLSLSRRMGCAP